MTKIDYYGIGFIVYRLIYFNQHPTMSYGLTIDEYCTKRSSARNIYDRECKIINGSSDVKHIKTIIGHYRDLISSEKNKIKMSVVKEGELEVKLANNIAKLKRDSNKGKRSLFTCSKCNRVFKSKALLAKHTNDYKKSKKSCSQDVNSWERQAVNTSYKIEVMERNYRNDLDKIRWRNDTSELFIGIYHSIIKFATERISDLSYTCSKCKKACTKVDLMSTSCSRNHEICSNCFENIDEECPICKEELELPTCNICMGKHQKLVQTGCGNGHSTCSSCLTMIKGQNNRCPFCRGHLNE